LAGEQIPQRVWHAEHPLAHWPVRQYFVHQQGGAFGHAPGTATGAETSAFATKGYQLLSLAAVALHTKKAVLKAATLEIRLELLVHVVGQDLAFGCQLRHKGWVVLLDKLVEQSLFRAVALVNRRIHAGFHASRQRHHDRILAIDSACRLPE